MQTLSSLVSAELAAEADPRVAAMGQAIAERHPDAARAVLFYGSCLRSDDLNGQMLDFYLIVSGYNRAYGKSWLARANALVPPNVFPFAHDGLVAKYAVLSAADFRRLCGPETRNVSVWARFAQPSRLVWHADDQARLNTIASISRAAPTLLWAALPSFAGDPAADPLALWSHAFDLTYSAELRAERSGRSASVVSFDPDRYRAFTRPALDAIEGPVPSPAAARRQWRARRAGGKALTLLRLAKASATYAGGVDYLAWKINRHAGTDIKLKRWQRRHPVLGAISLLPRLIRTGAIR